MTDITKYNYLLRGVTFIYSRGYGKNGKISAYVRPRDYSFNRDRKVSAFTNSELNQAIIECVQKWFNPIKYYKIDGHIIGSNNNENALKEYWRVCAKENKKKLYQVENLTT